MNEIIIKQSQNTIKKIEGQTVGNGKINDIIEDLFKKYISCNDSYNLKIHH